MIREITKELKAHAPFTLFGAATGVIIMVFFNRIPSGFSSNAFFILHPLHVVLSALVTASMYKLHVCKRVSGRCISGKCNLWYLLIIGYAGAIGVATISDSVIPYLGEILLEMPNREIHLGFIEKWWLVNPLAILGVLIAVKWPTTKFPHYGHVLLSTWASLFHIIMAAGENISLLTAVAIFFFLFIAVWIPCCISDIIFPLMFVKRNGIQESSL